MSTLTGSGDFTVDSKGRVKIPARMLKALSNEANDSFMLTVGQNKSIFAYPMDQWKIIEGKLRELNSFDKKHRYFMVRFLKDTEEAPLDAQQRIILPKRLTEQAEISDSVAIIGMVDHIEFWNPKRLEEYINTYDDEFEQISQEVMS